MAAARGFDDDRRRRRADQRRRVRHRRRHRRSSSRQVATRRVDALVVEVETTPAHFALGKTALLDEGTPRVDDEARAGALHVALRGALRDLHIESFVRIRAAAAVSELRVAVGVVARTLDVGVALHFVIVSAQRRVSRTSTFPERGHPEDHLEHAAVERGGHGDAAQEKGNVSRAEPARAKT